MNDDFDRIAKIANKLQSEYAKAGDPWAESPFGWIRQLPSRTVGAIGEKIVERWATEQGFEVERSGDSDADRVIGGIRIEIKFSTLWTNNELYKFQQIRNQNYQYCLCVGISPYDVAMWLIPKRELAVPREGLSHQHGGTRGADTMWLSFPASNPPDWLSEFGGTLSAVRELLGVAIAQKHASS